MFGSEDEKQLRHAVHSSIMWRAFHELFTIDAFDEWFYKGFSLNASLWNGFKESLSCEKQNLHSKETFKSFHCEKLLRSLSCKEWQVFFFCFIIVISRNSYSYVNQQRKRNLHSWTSRRLTRAAAHQLDILTSHFRLRLVWCFYWDPHLPNELKPWVDLWTNWNIDVNETWMMAI